MRLARRVGVWQGAAPAARATAGALALRAAFGAIAQMRLQAGRRARLRLHMHLLRACTAGGASVRLHYTTTHGCRTAQRAPTHASTPRAGVPGCAAARSTSSGGCRPAPAPAFSELRQARTKQPNLRSALDTLNARSGPQVCAQAWRNAPEQVAARSASSSRCRPAPLAARASSASASAGSAPAPAAAPGASSPRASAATTARLAAAAAAVRRACARGRSGEPGARASAASSSVPRAASGCRPARVQPSFCQRVPWEERYRRGGAGRAALRSAPR